MPEVPPKSRWKRVLLAAGAGCLPGLIFGLVAGAVIGVWAWIELGGDQPTDPLAGLGIREGHFTLDEMQPHVDRFAREYLSDAKNVGLVIGMLQQGEQRVFAFGRVGSGDGDAKPDGDTVFEIASVGKTFTATMLAEMHLAGELSWDDALSGFLPAGLHVPTFGGKEISLLDLATQTSGLPSLPPNFQTTNALNPYADYTSRAVGLGWHIDSENALDIIWHNGGAGGSRSYVAFLREPQVGVVVLSNSNSEVDELGRKVLYLLALH